MFPISSHLNMEYTSRRVMSKDYFEMLKAEGTNFVKNVLREGVTVYART